MVAKQLVALTLVRRGDEELKADFETLLAGGAVVRRVDERVRRPRCST